MNEKLENGTTGYFNFDLEHEGEREQFHIKLENNKILIADGLHDQAIGILKAMEETIAGLMEMGSDLIASLMDLSFNKLPENTDLPDIDQRLSLATILNDHPVNFNIFIQNNQLNVIEEKEVNGDIRIRIKPDYLARIFNGQVNLPVALMTGKIKIENKIELFKLLARFGLKI
jgi:hypothetical protein